MNAPTLPLRWGEGGLPAAPGKILLVQISAMGDQVQTLPAVSDIAARWPEVVIDWAVDARFADIPRLHPAVRRVIALPLKAAQSRSWLSGLRSLQAPLRELRAEQYDLIWDPHSVLKSAIVSRLARGRLRVGYTAADCGGEPLAARAYGLHFSRPPGVHGTDGRRHFAHAVFDTDLRRAPDYAIDRRVAPLREPQQSPAVFFAHGTSKPEKLWPEVQWVELAQYLVARGLRIVLTWGNEAEHERAQRIAAAVPAHGVSLLDRRPVVDLLGVIAGCALVVGVDTGLTHLAAALRRPVVALFVDTGAELFTPTRAELARVLGGNGVAPQQAAVQQACEALLASATEAGTDQARNPRSVTL